MNIADTSAFPPAESLIARKDRGESWCSIARSLITSPSVVRRYVAGNILIKPTGSLEDDAHRRLLINLDEKFVTLMQQAIKAGLEKASFGIKVDHTSFCAKRFRPTQLQSYCGSSSANCTDYGDKSARAFA